MKKTLLLLLCSSVLNAQNIMNNGDFEIFSSQPTGYNQLNKATGWSNCNGNYNTQGSWGSPDYLSLQGTGVALLPCGYVACIPPYSGNAVAGFITYNGFSVDNREYIRNSFSTPMNVGSQYYVEFYLTTGTTTTVKYVTNNIGVRFSKDSTWQPAPYKTMPHIPQYNITSVVDTIGWKKYSFFFTADSAYKYITIGNYKNDANTTLVVKNAGSSQLYSYYGIDHIAVTKINGVGAQEHVRGTDDLIVYPNPGSGQLFVRGTKDEKLRLFNELGQLVKEFELRTENRHEFTISGLEPGIYFLNGNNSNKKIVVIK